MSKGTADAFHIHGTLFRLVPLPTTEEMDDKVIARAAAEVHRKGGAKAGAGTRILEAGIFARPSIDLGPFKTCMRKHTKDQLGALLYDAHARIQELEAAQNIGLEKAEKDLEAWRARCVKSQNELSEARASRDVDAGKNVQLRARNERLMAEVDGLRKKLNEVRGDVINGELAQARSRVRQLEGRHGEDRQKLDEAVHRGDLLQVDLTQKKSELSQAEEKLAQSNDALAAAAKREESLTADLAKLRQEMADRIKEARDLADDRLQYAQLMQERCQYAERALDIVERLLEVTDGRDG